MRVLNRESKRVLIPDHRCEDGRVLTHVLACVFAWVATPVLEGEFGSALSNEDQSAYRNESAPVGGAVLACGVLCALTHDSDRDSAAGPLCAVAQ